MCGAYNQGDFSARHWWVSWNFFQQIKLRFTNFCFAGNSFSLARFKKYSHESVEEHLIKGTFDGASPKARKARGRQQVCRCAGDTCGTGRRHLAGAALHSASYVVPFLCDRLVVKCSLPDLPSFCAHFKSLLGRKSKNSEIRKWFFLAEYSFQKLIQSTSFIMGVYLHDSAES